MNNNNLRDQIRIKWQLDSSKANFGVNFNIFAHILQRSRSCLHIPRSRLLRMCQWPSIFISPVDPFLDAVLWILWSHWEIGSDRVSWALGIELHRTSRAGVIRTSSLHEATGDMLPPYTVLRNINWRSAICIQTRSCIITCELRRFVICKRRKWVVHSL